MADDHRITRFVWERELLKRGPKHAIARAVLLALATHANRDLMAYPSVLTICKETCYSERSARDALNLGEHEGWISRTARRDGGKAWANYVYTLTLPPIAAASGAGPIQQGAAPIAGPNTAIAAAIRADGAAPGAEGAASDSNLDRHPMPLNNVPASGLNNKSNTPRAPLLKNLNSKPEHASSKGPMAWASELGLRAQWQDETVTEYLAFVNLAVSKHQEAQQ